MPTVLRIIGGVWILLTLGSVLGILQKLFHNGFSFSLGVTDILSLIMLAGAIGLILLKEWGRWILLIGSVAFLVLLTGPSLLHFKIGPVVIRHFVFYGIFIAILILPQAKAATQ
jgi:hypothetical protein